MSKRSSGSLFSSASHHPFYLRFATCSLRFVACSLSFATCSLRDAFFFQT